MKIFELFPVSSACPLKKRTNRGSRSPSPEPPEASRRSPGRVKTAAKSATRAAKTTPKRRPGALPAGPSAAQERFRPKSSPRPPGGYFGSLGARFQTLRGPLGEASAAACAPFRGALAIASRPFHSTAPEVKKAGECQNYNPAKRQSKQSLALKPLANKGARQCGRSQSQYTHTLSQKNGRNKLLAVM